MNISEKIFSKKTIEIKVIDYNSFKNLDPIAKYKTDSHLYIELEHRILLDQSS